MGDQLPPLVDTKLLGKPKPYSGQRSDWQQWKYVFKAYLGALDTQLAQSVDLAEQQQDPIPYEPLSEAKKQHSRTLTFILCQVLTVASLQLVMSVPGYRGLEARRRLVKQEEPATGAAQVTQLTGVLNAKFDGGARTFAEQLQKLEGRSSSTRSSAMRF